MSIVGRKTLSRKQSRRHGAKFRPVGLLRGKNPTSSTRSGFTIVEVTIVVIIIGIMATISALSMSGVLISSRDKQRSAKTTVLAEALEKYFQQNGVYPTCDKLTQPANIVTTTILPGLDPATLAAPGAAAGTNSITCETNGTNMITYNLADNGAYTLEYTTELDKKPVVVSSRYNGGALLGEVNLTVESVTSNRVRLRWQSVVDATSYRVQRSTSSDFKSGVIEDNTTGLSFNSNSLASGVKYYFRVMAKGVNASSPWASVNAITLIDAPSKPSVTIASTTTTTTFNWPTVTCSAGTTANYQYKYNINGTDISGWTSPSAIPFVATTNYQGSIYTFTLRANCITADAVSPWSPNDVVSYTRPINPPTLPVVTASYSAPYARASVSPVTCGLGTTAEYGIRYRTNDGAWGAYSAWSTNTTLSIVATQGVKYGFMAQARCNMTLGSSSVITSAEAIYIHPIINPPSTPAVVASTSGNNTTWSWPAATCSGGTPSYQYRYTINNGYDSGWTSIASSPFTAATSNEGYTFTVAVQAKCSSAYVSSAWSNSGTASYYRPIKTYTLTVNSGSGGYATGGGTFNSGTTRTVTAVPYSGYRFNYWSGNCSGTSTSTNITMYNNYTCTANFVANVTYYSLSVYAGSGGSASGNASGITSGTSKLISASPNSGYSFSSWSGSGCSGSASHYVTVYSNMSCTANFTKNAPVTKTVNTTVTQSSSTFAPTLAYNSGGFSGTLSYKSKVTNPAPTCSNTFTWLQVAGLNDGNRPYSPQSFTWTTNPATVMKYTGSCTVGWRGTITFLRWDTSSISNPNWNGQVSYYSKWSGSFHGSVTYTGTYSGTVTAN